MIKDRLESKIETGDLVIDIKHYGFKFGRVAKISSGYCEYSIDRVCKTLSSCMNIIKYPETDEALLNLLSISWDLNGYLISPKNTWL